jgi:hypothetical protein
VKSSEMFDGNLVIWLPNYPTAREALGFESPEWDRETRMLYRCLEWHVVSTPMSWSWNGRSYFRPGRTFQQTIDRLRKAR